MGESAVTDVIIEAGKVGIHGSKWGYTRGKILHEKIKTSECDTWVCLEMLDLPARHGHVHGEKDDLFQQWME